MKRIKRSWNSFLNFYLHARPVLVLHEGGGIGNITKLGKNGVLFQINSLQNLINIVIPYFNKFPLLTQKKADFRRAALFKMVVEIMSRKDHLTVKGLPKIVAIKASINLGLSDELKAIFPNTIPVERPQVSNQKIYDPQ